MLFRSFEVNAVDYLLKPVDPARLEQAVERTRRRLASERSGAIGPQRPSTDTLALGPQQLQAIMRLVADRRAKREQFALKVGDRLLLVHADEIIFASTVDEVIQVATAQHIGASNFRTLEELHAHLDPAIFWRVHRGHVVNINMIKEIVPWLRNCILRMKDPKATEIPVSRAQTQRLREYLKL